MSVPKSKIIISAAQFVPYLLIINTMAIWVEVFRLEKTAIARNNIKKEYSHRGFVQTYPQIGHTIKNYHLAFYLKIVQQVERKKEAILAQTCSVMLAYDQLFILITLLK